MKSGMGTEESKSGKKYDCILGTLVANLKAVESKLSVPVPRVCF